MKDSDTELARAKRQDLIPVSTEIIPDLFAAQHAYTTACDGFHEPGQCPRSQQAVQAEVRT